MPENSELQNQTPPLSEPAKTKPGIGVKLVALLLIPGSILGVGFGLWSEFNTLGQIPIPLTALQGVFVLLFGWCAWTGFELWQGKPRAFTNAKIIFLAQILNFTVPGFSFDGFYTGLRIWLSVSERAPNLRFGFNFQAMIHFAVSPQIDYWLFGINFIGVIAFFYLRSASRPARPKADRFGLL
jgi:hypothetical protein